MGIAQDLIGKDTGDNDVYGHWWVELRDGTSYGWWPCGPGSNITGRPGCVNAGNGSRDPKHGKHGDWEGNASTHEPCDGNCDRACGDAQKCLKRFAQGYSGSSSLKRNCHDFIDESLTACKLGLSGPPSGGQCQSPPRRPF